MSEAPSTQFIAAAVQAAPVYFDLQGTVDKTIDLIKEAAGGGARLVVFPEAWVPGYPLWAWMDSPLWAIPWGAQYAANSLVLGSPEERRIAAAAREHKIHVVLGASLRGGASLYIAQIIYNARGERIAVRRKLKPTGAERAVFGEGSGVDLTVYDTNLGRLGALACWEHLTLSAHALHAQNEEIHAGSWPSYSMYREVHQLSAEANDTASRTYALAGACYVIAATAITTQAIIDQLCETEQHRKLIWPGGGRSMVFAPDGRPMTDYLEPDQEGLVYAEIDPALARAAKALIDLSGHSASPNAVRLVVDNRSRPIVRFTASRSDGPDGELTPRPDAPAGEPTATAAADDPAGEHQPGSPVAPG
jgi:aliphatic nitrilase